MNKMNKYGFGLLELIITVGIIGLLFWGGTSLSKYATYAKREKKDAETSSALKSDATAVKKIFENTNKSLERAVNE
jgi:prepilin-type N-terminal cleavage/methylation domain-containing protein